MRCSSVRDGRGVRRSVHAIFDWPFYRTRLLASCQNGAVDIYASAAQLREGDLIVSAYGVTEPDGRLVPSEPFEAGKVSTNIHLRDEVIDVAKKGGTEADLRKYRRYERVLVRWVPMDEHAQDGLNAAISILELYGHRSEASLLKSVIKDHVTPPNERVEISSRF